MWTPCPGQWSAHVNALPASRWWSQVTHGYLPNRTASPQILASTKITPVRFLVTTDTYERLAQGSYPKARRLESNLRPVDRKSSTLPLWRRLKFIENDTIQTGTHDFLLTFHNNHQPISHRFRDKRRFPSKIARKSPINCYPSVCPRTRQLTIVSGGILQLEQT